MKHVETPVAGLFDSESQAEDALEALDRRGIAAQHINVIDRSRLHESLEPRVPSAVGATLAGGPQMNETIQPNPIAIGGLSAGVADETINLEAELNRLGIEDPAAQYYANGIRNGGTVIVVDVKGDEARAAAEALADAGATNRR